MGFSRWEYWNGLPCPPPGDIPEPGTEPTTHVSCISRQALTTSTTQKAHWLSLNNLLHHKACQGQSWDLNPGWGRPLSHSARLLPHLLLLTRESGKLPYPFFNICNFLQRKWKMPNCVWLFVTPWTDGPWNSPGQNTGVGSFSLLQGIFPTQGLSPGLLHCWQILYQLSHKRSPKILEWVAYPFSSGSSWPRNRTRVSCIAGGFFTNWATRDKGTLGNRE